MEDRGIVAALAAGDPAGIVAAYDTYAETVYGYCRWMLREPAEAAEATQDTFVVAAAGTPADPGLLRSWLFATARGECLRRPSLVRGESVHAADLEGATGAAGAGENKRETERAELRALIPATVAELEPEQREAVVLSLWHDLDDADLAAVFGVSRPEAYAMASGGRGQLEKALGTLRIARTGRAACPELGTLLADWDGRLTMDTLHLAGRHIEQCRTCAAGKRGKLRPEALTRLLPLPALPAGLREQVLELCAGNGPEAIAYREQVRERAGALFPARFAAAAGAAAAGAAGAVALAGWSKARGHPRVAAAVAVAAIAAAVSVPVMAAGSTHAPRALVPRASTGTFASASAPVPAGGGASVSTGTSSSPSPSRQPTVAAGLAPSPWSPPEPSPSKSARPSRSASPKASPSSSSPSSSSPSSSSPSSSSPSPSPSPSPTPTPTRTRSPSPSPSPSSSSPSPSPSVTAS